MSHGPWVQYGVVYSITHLASGKAYIGCTVRPEARWKQHQQCAARGVDHPLYEAIRRYGVEAFRFEILSQHDQGNPGFREERRLLSTGAFYAPAGFNKPGNNPPTWPKHGIMAILAGVIA